MPIGLQEKQHRLESALHFMLTHYLLDKGCWNEYLDELNQAKTYPLSGTTGYHIFLGIVEVLRWQQNQRKL